MGLKRALEILQNQTWSKAHEFGEALENGTTHPQQIEALEAKLAKAREALERVEIRLIDMGHKKNGGTRQIITKALKEINSDG